MRYKLKGKHFSVFFFFCWFSLRFREITYAQKRRRNKRFFCFSFDKIIAKEAARKLDVFCIRYFSKTKRKPAEKKRKHREMFSYQFVAHMPKIRQNKKTKNKKQNGPKFDTAGYAPGPSINISAVNLIAINLRMSEEYYLITIITGLMILAWA